MVSRHLKIVILNKQNLIKSNFLDINVKDNKKKNDTPENDSLKVSNNKQVYFVIEPNEYIRHYDEIITVVC